MCFREHGNNLVQLVRDALQSLLAGFRGHRNTRKSNDIISVDDIIHAMVVTATGSGISIGQFVLATAVQPGLTPYYAARFHCEGEQILFMIYVGSMIWGFEV